MAVFLTGASVLQGAAWLEGFGVLLEEGRIAGLRPGDQAVAARRVILPAGTRLAPGLIDLHVNGGGGVLFNDAPDARTAAQMAAAHRRLGTTSILPTLITDAPERLRQAIAHAACPEGVVGLHLEGPFIGPEKPGVHVPEHIRAMDEADIPPLLALARRLPGKLLMTVAPETVDDAALRRLSGAGIRLCAGHTAAGFARMEQAIGAGISGFTHLFNAMPPPSAREPGPVGAALLHPETWCGVIADGVHVAPAMLRLLKAARGLSRVFLVSDSMPPAGTGQSGFMLQGRQILRRDGRLETADGTLAGADLSLMDAVRRAVTLFGIGLAEALSMASTIPAAYLGLGSRGRIAAGMRADLLLLDTDAEVLGTWVGGGYSGAALFAGGEADAVANAT